MFCRRWTLRRQCARQQNACKTKKPYLDCPWYSAMWSGRPSNRFSAILQTKDGNLGHVGSEVELVVDVGAITVM